MSYVTAERIRRETGHSVEWSPANREYVIWPEGIPYQYARDVRRKIAELEAAEEARLAGHRSA